MGLTAWRQPVRIADAVSSTLRRLGLESRIRQHDIWRLWPLVVGPQIASRAQPFTMAHGRLVVHVTDSVWLHHLSMMRHRLIAVLNDRLKHAEIREMVLRVGEVPAIPAGTSSHATLPSVESEAGRLDPALVAEIEDTLATLGDAPFRDALRRLWLRAAHETMPSPDAPTNSRLR